MSLHLRRSVHVGPLIFTLGTSGIVVFAAGPRLPVLYLPPAHHLRAARGGFQYRATLPRHGDGPRLRAPTEDSDDAAPPMTEVTPDDLVGELNERRTRWRVAPFIALLGAAALAASYRSAGSLTFWLLGLIVAAAVLGARQWDVLRRTTVVLYDMGPAALAEYRSIVHAVTELGRAEPRDAATGRPALVRCVRPPFVACNLDVPALALTRHTLYFFPDQLLVAGRSELRGLPYDALTLHRPEAHADEGDGAPAEGDLLHLTGDEGLSERLVLSRRGAGEALVRIVRSRRRTAASRGPERAEG